MLSAAEISTLENTGGALTNPNFPNPNGSNIWAPTFYDPFQVKHRRRTSKKQFSILEKAFNENPKPNAATRRDLAEKLKMTVRGVQVWFQNRRAKAKAQKLKMAKKNGSTASSPSESEKNAKDSTESSNESSSESTSKKESSESTTEKAVSSPSSLKDIKDESKSTVDIDNKFKLEKVKLEKEYSLIGNQYFQVDDDASQGMVPFDTTPDYFFDKQDAALNQGFGPSPLSTDFYGSGQLMNRRCRANSLPNVYHLGGVYISPQQQLANPLNQTIPFQGLHQHPQLQTQAQSYSLIGGQKAAAGSYSPQSLQFLSKKTPFSPNTFLYTQKSQSLSALGQSSDSVTSSPSLGSEKGSQSRLSAGLAKHPDIFYGVDSRRGYYMASPGLGDNIPSPHSTTSNGYSPSYQSFIPDVSSINGIRQIDDSFGYMNNPYGIAQQTLSNPYAGNIPNFVPDLNAGAGVIPGIPTYPSGFNSGRRNSCPPEFLASVNSLQLSLDDNLTKQKGLETIKEDEGIE